ncbi:MAG TPA: UpxY family transcription antiterminator, partial [Longimicrobiales bacterium]
GILTDAERTPPAELYAEPHWYACYTRARHEKMVETQLRQRGLESYLPLVQQVRQWSDRKKVVQFPLFPSYVFGRFTLREVHAVLTTPGVSTIVRASGYPTPIADTELENVKRFAIGLAEAGIEPETRPFLVEGQWVRVLEGPFEGVEGMVVERRGRKRVLVGLAAIGQGLEIDIDTRLLKPIRK